MSEQAHTPDFGPADFRKELVKIIPGFGWTVHRSSKLVPDFLEATGIQSSGFNRLATLSVTRRVSRFGPWYEVKLAGYGTKALWLKTTSNTTLARALRDLQTALQGTANTFGQAAKRLQEARATPSKSGGADQSQNTENVDG